MDSKFSIVSTLALMAALCGCGGKSDMPAATPTQTQAQVLLEPRMLAQESSVSFPGNRSEYTISLSALTVTDNVSGAVQSVPAGARLMFADTAVAFDLDGNAGMAYRLYQAAFNRKPDLAGLGFQMNALDAQGFSLGQVSQGFINSPEFGTTYGALTDTAFVTLLYANVLKRAPDPDGLAFHVNYLAGPAPAPGVTTRAQDLIGFSESPENKALVLPAIQNGIEYTPSGFTPPSNPASDFSGSYTGSLSGTDSGALTLTLAANGTITVSAHSTVANADLSGSGAVQDGGKFSFAVSGNGRTMTFSGSVNLASGLATGVWTGANAADSGVFNAAIVVPPLPPQYPYQQVQAIITQRCLPCHSANPSEPGYNVAPLGITFDTEAQIRRDAQAINTYAVQSTFMPYQNATGMTDGERAVLAGWFAAGQP